MQPHTRIVLGHGCKQFLGLTPFVVRDLRLALTAALFQRPNHADDLVQAQSVDHSGVNASLQKGSSIPSEVYSVGRVSPATASPDGMSSKPCMTAPRMARATLSGLFGPAASGMLGLSRPM